MRRLLRIEAAGHQLLLIVSGNYAWLNWLTVVLGGTAFSDGVLGAAAPALVPRPLAYEIVLYAMGALTLALSIKPARNLLSKQQASSATATATPGSGGTGAWWTREPVGDLVPPVSLSR